MEKRYADPKPVNIEAQHPEYKVWQLQQLLGEATAEISALRTQLMAAHMKIEELKDTIKRRLPVDLPVGLK